MLAALCFAAVFALCLSSYVTMCYYSLNISNHNLGSSHAIELAETGLEDALWAVNNNSWSGWTLSGGNATLTESGSGYNYDNNVTGSVQLTVTGYNTGAPAIASVATLTLSDGATISRTISNGAGGLATVVAPEFINAVGALGGKVKFKSAGTVDSYDSRLGAYASQTPGSSAVIVSTDATANINVQLNNLTLNGYAVTGANATTSYASGATVTPANILTNINPNQPVYPENYPAYQNLISSISSSTSLGTPNAATPTVYYLWGDITLSSGATLTINGPVILVVYGNVSISGTGQIVITSDASHLTSSLELHAEGGVSIGGNGINNRTLLPKRLALLGSYSSGYAQTVSTTVAFYGVMYFPTDTLTISSALTAYGSIVAKSVTFDVSPVIHYDVALRTVDSTAIDAAFHCVSAPFAIAGWNEAAN